MPFCNTPTRTDRPAVVVFVNSVEKFSFIFPKTKNTRTSPLVPLPCVPGACKLDATGKQTKSVDLFSQCAFPRRSFYYLRAIKTLSVKRVVLPRVWSSPLKKKILYGVEMRIRESSLCVTMDFKFFFSLLHVRLIIESSSYEFFSSFLFVRNISSTVHI